MNQQPQAQQGPPLPFMPPLEPDQLLVAVDATARRLVQLDRDAFDALFDILTGWDQMPLRQKFATLSARIRALDTEAQMAGVVLPQPGVAFFQALATIDAAKTAELSKEYERGLKLYGGAQ